MTSKIQKLLQLEQNPQSQPTIFEAIEWWRTYLPLTDPHWKIKALHIYKIWRENNSADRRRFLSDFLDDTYKLIEEHQNRYENFSPFKDDIFKLSYVLMFFYYLFDTYYNRK